MARREEPAAEPTRDGTRYDFAVPMEIELQTRLLQPTDRVEAFLVDLSAGGAAIVTGFDKRLKPKKRYRVWIDGYSGLIQIRNLSRVADGQLRLGVSFSRLGLELQELVVDSLAAARVQATRLNRP